MFAMQRICMLPGGDSRFSEPNMAISGNISVVIKRWKDMFAISSLQNSLTSPAWGEDQRRWEGHSEVSKTQQLGTLNLGQVAKNVSGLPGRALRGRTNHCYGAVRCWENARKRCWSMDAECQSWELQLSGSSGFFKNMMVCWCFEFWNVLKMIK